MSFPTTKKKEMCVWKRGICVAFRVNQGQYRLLIKIYEAVKTQGSFSADQGLPLWCVPTLLNYLPWGSVWTKLNATVPDMNQWYWHVVITRLYPHKAIQDKEKETYSNLLECVCVRMCVQASVFAFVCVHLCMRVCVRVCVYIWYIMWTVINTN